jgi:hypothetical protein
MIQMHRDQTLLVAPTTTFDGTLTSFDPGTLTAGDYTAEIEWGDGTTSAGTMVANEDGSVGVVGSHTYTKSGEYFPDILIDGSDGSTGGAGRHVIVGASSLVSLHNPHLGTVTTSSPYELYLNSFYDPDNAQDAGAYTITIDWGDGSSGRGEVAAAGEGMSNIFDVTGLHAYAAEGHYTITITVARKGAVLTVTGSADVSDPWRWDIIYPIGELIALNGAAGDNPMDASAPQSQQSQIIVPSRPSAPPPLTVTSLAGSLFKDSGQSELDRSDTNVLD